jgi:YidC/Oxa1 family membrane protein insertase
VSSLGTIGHYILTPLYFVISAVLVGWHWLFGLVLDRDGGAAWVLSIIGLTLVIRAALIPLFVKQIKSSRNMQLIQPKVKELQKKYGHDREKLAQETMALYRETGTNPFASCLPLLVQMPIFLALFRLLDHAAKNSTGQGFLTDKLASSFGAAELFGSIPISDTFLKPDGHVSVRILAAVLVVAMTATTFLTQRQLMTKNMPKDAMTGPYAQQQKMLLYVLPVVFAVGGVAFPIGVLFYWTTTNLWTMGQQFYVIRRNPAPGTPAFEAKQKRDRAKGRVTDEPAPVQVAEETEAPTQRQRQQPKRQSRQQRKRGSGGGSGGGRGGGGRNQSGPRADRDEGKTA